MRWPGRKGAEATAESEAPAALTAPPRAWATLPPPTRTIVAPALTADPGRFVQRLAAWEQTGVTRQGVGHLRTEDAPVGQVHGLVRVLADQPAPPAASSPPVPAASAPSDPLPVARRDLTVAPDPPSPPRALAVLPTERPSRPADTAEPSGAGPTPGSSTIGSSAAGGTAPVVQPLSTAAPLPAPAPADEPARLVLSGEAGRAPRPGGATDPGATTAVTQVGTPGPSVTPPLSAGPAPSSDPASGPLVQPPPGGGDRPAPPLASGATVQAMPLSPAEAGLPSPSRRRAGLGAPLPSGATAPPPPGLPPPASGPSSIAGSHDSGPGAPTPAGPAVPAPGPSAGTGRALEGPSSGPPASTSTLGAPPSGNALPPGGTAGPPAVQRHLSPGGHDEATDETPADLPLNRLLASPPTVQTEAAPSAATGAGSPSAGSGDASLLGPGPSSAGADGATSGPASPTGSGPEDGTRPVLPLSARDLSTGTAPTTLNTGTAPPGALAAEPVGPLQRSPAAGARPRAGPASDDRGQPVEPGPSSGSDESVRPTLGTRDLGPAARSLLGEQGPAPGPSTQPLSAAGGPSGGVQRPGGGPITVLRQANGPGPVTPPVGAGGGRASGAVPTVTPLLAAGQVSAGPRGSTGPASAIGLPVGVQRAGGPPGPTQSSPSPNDRGGRDTPAGERTPLTLSTGGARPPTVVSRSTEPPPAAAVAEPAAAVPTAPTLVEAAPPAVQREAPPTPAPAPAASTGPASASAPAAVASAASTMSPAELDELSRKLYDRIRGRLSAELRIDRERTGSLIEPSF